MKAEQALDIVALLTAAFPNWKPNEATQRLWVKFMTPLDAELTKPAILELIAEPRQFAPSIGEVLTKAAQRKLAIQGRAKLLPEEAWAEVQSAIRQIGYYRYPSHLDPTVLAAIQAIGWGELCTSENLVANRAHFFRTYEALRQRETSDEISTLVGHEMGWALEVSTPQRVENQRRATGAAPAQITTPASGKPLSSDMQDMLDRIRQKARSAQRKVA